MDKHYVSEFTAFMDRYMQEHPDAAEEQVRDWDEDWHPRLDLEAVNKAPDDVVPDDSYGFAWTAWRTKPSGASNSGTAGRH